MTVIAVATLDELITRVLQGCSLKGLVPHHARLALLVGLLDPVGTLSIIEVLGDTEFSMKYFALSVDLVFNHGLTAQIVVVVVHSESVILDFLLRGFFAGWNEILLISFAQGLSDSVTHDVSITNLLVNGGVVDESALHLRGRLISHWLLHVLHLLDGVHGYVSFLAFSTHHSVIHLLEVFTDTSGTNTLYRFTI